MKKIKENAACRVLAVLLAAAALTAAVASTWLLIMMGGIGAYTDPGSVIKKLERGCVDDDYWEVLEIFNEVAERPLSDSDAAYAELASRISAYSEKGDCLVEVKIGSQYITDTLSEWPDSETFQYENVVNRFYGPSVPWFLVDQVTGEPYVVTIRMMVKNSAKSREIFASRSAASFMTDHRTLVAVPIVAAASALLFSLLFAFTLSASGHRKGSDTVELSLFDRVPFDLVFAVSALLAAALLYPLGSAVSDIYNFRYESDASLLAAQICFFLVVFALALLAVIICATASVRVKCRTILSCNVITYAARLLSRAVMAIPIVWRTLLASVAAAAVSLYLVARSYMSSVPIILLLILWAAVTVLLSYNAYCLHRLRAAGKRIASGDLSHRIDTKGLHGDYLRHAEDLNNIGVGIETAVEERMKSERFRTELITNVSHDIKTPLTSIINYVDLLRSPGLDEETAKSYLDVLDRQSQSLRRLTEDLIEASKASSGTLPVELSPVGLGVLVSQAAGEYEEKLSSSGLTLVTRAPSEPIYVMADGRHTARIIDNLMSNVCKYAMPGTRVYMEVKIEGVLAGISVTNVSREPLSVAADELTERFVRGDASRHTEGSGLGLSIASSLAEIQGGSLTVKTDADLFRVTLLLQTA